MVRRAIAWLVIGLVSTATGACGDRDAGSRRGGPTTSTGEARVSIPGLSTVPSTTTTAPASLFEFVDYRVSGGLAGVRDHLRIYPDGRAIYDDGSAFRQLSLPPNAVAELRSALERADVASLPPVNGTPTPDVQQYNVIFGGRSVRFVEGAVPPPLAPAVTILNRELARAKAGR